MSPDPSTGCSSSPFALQESVRQWWSGLPNAYRTCWIVAAALTISGLTHLGFAVVSDRPWSGPLSWRKPGTFGVSFGITLASTVWIISQVPGPANKWRRWLLCFLAVDCVLEVGGITVQAWRGVPSHFNKETSFDSAVANTLAAGGAGLFLIFGALAVTVHRNINSLAPPFRLGLRAGFAILFLSLGSGVAMIARGVALSGEGVVDGAWDDAAYSEAGFLKEFHGVTLHAVPVLPVLGAVLARTRLTAVAQMRIMIACVGLYVVAAGAVLVWNLSSR